MAENSWPFEDQITTEAQYSRLLSAVVESGVVGGLGVSVASGMNVSIAAGEAIVRGFFYENTSAKPLTVEAAPAAGQTRKDYVLLRLDLQANSITAVVKTGVANTSGGSLPSLTQVAGGTWELPLAEITVASGTISLSSGMIERRQVPLGIRVLPYGSSDERPTPVLSAVALGINTSTRRMDLWTGGQWYSITPDVSWNAITGKPSTFPAEPHSHAWDDITGKPSNFTPAPHAHDDRYYQKSEVASLLGGKANASHTHDDRYYTETEINSLLADKASAGHTHSLASLGYPGDTPGSVGDIAGKVVSRGSDGRFGVLDATGGTHPVNKSQLDPVADKAQLAMNGELYAAVYSRTISSNWRELFINSNGTLGWVSSSRRFKQDMAAAEIDAATVLQLAVKTFRYRAAVRADGDAAGVETGLIAEEVDELGLNFLVDYDEEGRPEGVHYSRLALALIPALQQQATRIDELSRELTELRGTISAETSEG